MRNLVIAIRSFRPTTTMGGSSAADSRWKIGAWAAVVLFAILFVSKLPPKTTKASTPVQQTQILDADADVNVDPYCIPWRDTKLDKLNLKPSTFKVQPISRENKLSVLAIYFKIFTWQFGVSSISQHCFSKIFCSAQTQMIFTELACLKM